MRQIVSMISMSNSYLFVVSLNLIIYQMDINYCYWQQQKTTYLKS